jgi:16S rRNA (cytosine967-C5)-methyltransferase
MSEQPDNPQSPPQSSGLMARSAALDLLERIRGGQTLDEALTECRTFDVLTGADRGFARALATAVLRRRGSLDHLLGAYIDRPLPKKAVRVMDILRLATVQMVYMGTPAHAAASTAVYLAADRRETAGYAKLINAVARKIAKAGTAAAGKIPARADTPAWLWRSWERAYGPQTTRHLAKAHSQEPPLDIALKNPDETQAFAEHLEAEVLFNGVLRLRGAKDITALPGFADGAWWVQDAAAVLPAMLLGDISGKTVYDLCAAPGGKTMQLAARGANVTAVDISAPRLSRVSENLGRTNLTAEIAAEDVLRWRPKGKADAILLDAPCSATGTIRRHPDIPWAKSETDVKALTALQAKMIDRALTFLKPGGVLVYCVCSLQREEGEAQARAALERHGALSRTPIDKTEIGGLAEAVTRDGDLRTLPSMLADKGGMDGFFAARFTLTN